MFMYDMLRLKTKCSMPSDECLKCKGVGGFLVMGLEKTRGKYREDTLIAFSYLGNMVKIY